MADPEKKAGKGKRKAESSVPVRRAEARPVERGAPPLWGLMRRMEEEMAQMWHSFLSGGVPGPSMPRAYGPRVDVYETDSDVTVKAELPGVDPKDIQIDATEDSLALSGEMRREEKIEEEGYYRAERSFGSFHRHIDLPAAVKAGDAKATFRNGVLEITMPKVEEAKPRTVKVPIETD